MVDSILLEISTALSLEDFQPPRPLVVGALFRLGSVRWMDFLPKKMTRTSITTIQSVVGLRIAHCLAFSSHRPTISWMHRPSADHSNNNASVSRARMEVSDPSQPSEETPLVGDAESPASTATGTSVGATSVREAEAAAPWPATLERGLSLLATPQIGDAQFADAVTKSPRFGYYNAAAGAGGLRQRKVCICVGVKHLLCLCLKEP